MNIEDFEIKIKKYDRDKNHVIVNVLIQEVIEIRGFLCLYTSTKYSVNPVWIVNPPSVRKGKVRYWLFEIKNIDLWHELQNKIVDLVKEYTNI